MVVNILSMELRVLDRSWVGRNYRVILHVRTILLTTPWLYFPFILKSDILTHKGWYTGI